MSLKPKKRKISQWVHKATRNTTKLPKERHVRNLIRATFHGDDIIQEIIRFLVKRLEKRNWLIVLKALQLFHLCYRDGHVHFIESLKPRSTAIFMLRKFNASNLKGHVITLFVKKYSKYLEEKVSVLRLLGLQFEKQLNATKKLKLDLAFKRIPKLQSQLNALLNCKIRSTHILQNPLIVTSYSLLLNDSQVLFPLLQTGIAYLLKRYPTMGSVKAQKTLDIYKLYLKEIEALTSLYEAGRGVASNLPKIESPDPSILQQMEVQFKKSDKKPEENGHDDPPAANDQQIEDSISGEDDAEMMKQEDSESGEDDLDEQSSNPTSPTKGNTPVVASLGPLHRAPSDSFPISSVPTFSPPNPTVPLQNVTVPLQNITVPSPTPFDPFGLESFSPPIEPNNSNMFCMDPQYQKKAENIKNLVTSLYSTSFDTYNNINSMCNTKEMSLNPFEPQPTYSPSFVPDFNGEFLPFSNSPSTNGYHSPNFHSLPMDSFGSNTNSIGSNTNPFVSVPTNSQLSSAQSMNPFL